MLLFEFLAVGTFGFMAVLLLAGIAVSELADRDRSGLATLVAVGTLAVLAVLGDLNPVTWAIDHPLAAALVAVGYVAGGALWGVVKWKLFVRSRRRTTERLAAEFLDERGLPEDAAIPEDEDTQRAWQWILERHGIRGSLKPEVRENRLRIIAWMSYWPASFAWTVLNDPLRRIFAAVYERLGTLLQRISDREWEGTDRFLPPGNRR